MGRDELQFIDRTRLVFVGKGILVGGLTGIVVSLFRLLIEHFSDFIVTFYESSQHQPLRILLWTILSIGTALFVGWLIKSEPNIKGSGIPQVEGQLQDEIDYPWFSVLWKKFVGGALSVGAGLFLGREGPSIQLGATIGQGVADTQKVPKFERKILISSGASAGLAAAFNAPIAGLLFVIEEVHHTFSPLVWLTSFASALTANFISLYVFGLQPVLYLGSLQDVPLSYYWLFILFGLVLGLFARFYQYVLLGLPRLFRHLPLPSYFHGMLPFLLVIPIGLFFPHMLGGGNQIITSLEQDNYGIALLVGLFALRFIFSIDFLRFIVTRWHLLTYPNLGCDSWLLICDHCRTSVWTRSGLYSQLYYRRNGWLFCSDWEGSADGYYSHYRNGRLTSSSHGDRLSLTRRLFSSR